MSRRTKHGLGDGQEMSWLLEDMCTQLRAWGHAGGAGGELIVKSGGEPALLAVKRAVMKHHGERLSQSSPPRPRKQNAG